MSRPLAVLGGQPAFKDPLHVGRPNIGNRERLLERFEQILDRRWFTNNGPVVQELEARLAEYLGVKHCVATCNATIALQIAIRGLHLTGEVIAPSFTFIATVHALSWQELTPVFCDVDATSHNLAPAEIEALITPRTSAVIPVHVWGRGCDVDAIADIARRHKLKVIYDAAHAFGCTVGGRKIGGFGDAEVFSFHATKFFNSFEGGAITTNDDDLATRLRLMRNFGFAGYDNVIHLGINGKMTEVSAAMGLTSLEDLPTFLEANSRNYEAYRTRLADLPGLSLVTYDEKEEQNRQYVVVDIDEQTFGLTRDQLVKALHAENVLARRYFYPAAHRMEPYATNGPAPRRPLVVTEALVRRLVSLPTGTAVTVEEIDVICGLIRAAREQAAAVRAAVDPD